MDWRMRLFSYLFAVFFGVLLAQFRFSGDEPPASPRIVPEGAPAEVIELRARLQSEQALRRQLESRIARLRAEKPPVASDNSAVWSPDAPHGGGGRGGGRGRGGDRSCRRSPGQQRSSCRHDSYRGLHLSPLQSFLSWQLFADFSAIIDQVSLGEVDPAIQDVQKLSCLAALPDNGPFAGCNRLQKES